MRAHASEIEALRTAAEQYQALAHVVARITRNNPRGLQIKPLLSRAPQPRPAPVVFRHQAWREPA